MDSLTAADPQTVGEFRLLARLGSGGMGQVFLASSLAGRIVAVKVIHSELCRDPEFVRRFRGEVEAAAKVSGWYTAPVVAAGVDEHPPWLATAFVPGPSLEDIVRRYGPLPTPAVWRLAAGLAEALRAIHGTGLVHRDLKPANVLLALDGPRVIDFGISRAVTDTRVTATGVIIGTPSYMSPEQVDGLVAGPASDVFSLGSVLTFAASGSAPFGGGRGVSATSVMYRIVHAEPDLGAIPGHVRELIEACLIKDPRQRADLVRVAARSTAAAERLGLSPAMFWPHEVAKVIQAQQAALTAQIEALQVAPATHLEGNWRGNEIAAASPGRGAPEPRGLSLEGAHAIPRHGGVTRGTSRRGLLIGVGVGGVAIAGGALGWVISSSPAASAPPATGTGHTQRQPGQALPSEGPLQRYYGAGTPRTATWKFSTDNAIEANPGAANGVVYVGSTDNNFYAVRIATGRQAWSFQSGAVSAAPDTVGDVVCFSTSSGHFYALRAVSGARAWDMDTGVGAASYKRTWAVDGRSVILAQDPGPPQAFDAATGTKGVTFRMREPFVMALAAAHGVLCTLDTFGTLYAFQATTGNELWHKQLLSTDDPPGTGLVINGGSIYVGTISGTLYAIGANSGRVLWKYHPGSGIVSDPAVAGGVVYLKDNNGILHAISAASSKPVWTHAVSAGLRGLSVAGGGVYYTTGIALQALDAKTGTPVWSFTAPGDAPLLSTPAVASGLVFVGCHDDGLYAIKA
jgi:outer membrane protein assembly factor BamB